MRKMQVNLAHALNEGKIHDRHDHRAHHEHHARHEHRDHHDRHYLHDRPYLHDRHDLHDHHDPHDLPIFSDFHDDDPHYFHPFLLSKFFAIHF